MIRPAIINLTVGSYPTDLFSRKTHGMNSVEFLCWNILENDSCEQNTYAVFEIHQGILDSNSKLQKTL